MSNTTRIALLVFAGGIKYLWKLWDQIFRGLLTKIGFQIQTDPDWKNWRGKAEKVYNVYKPFTEERNYGSLNVSAICL